VEGIDQNRLAGTRLAGQDVEAGGEADLQLVDDREVLDAKSSEHGPLASMRG